MDGMLTSAGEEGYSLTRLILDADPVVQTVMLGLVIASIICWTVIFEKIVQLRLLSRNVRKLEVLAKGDRIEGDPRLLRAVLAAAQDEMPPSAGETPNEVQTRLERAMRSAVKTEFRRYDIGLPFLATVGSAAPFVGLFGTVWGIMNSFTSIAQAKDTSLAVVAPGIAEALFATGLGLAAAIPAVIAYNQISVSLGRSAARIGTAVTALAKQFAFGQRAQKRG
jgi:biopolymer transport protein ExbB/TolQ